MTIRLILWQLGTMTITRRGIWQRERSLIDVVEINADEREELETWRARFGATEGCVFTEHVVRA
jgi:hypothetical protein